VRLWADIKERPHEFQNYDVVHINAHGMDIGLATKTAELLKGLSTKLVINMDLSTTYFDKGMNLYLFLNDLTSADYLFGVCPTQVNLMNYLGHITHVRDGKKKAVLLEHPINIPMLLNEWVDYKERMNVVAFQYHKYDCHWEVPRMLMLDLPQDYLAAMLGFMGETINMGNILRKSTITHELSVNPHLIMPYQEWTKYIDFLKRCKIGFEYRTHKAASRFVMEAGALGIPVVTTMDSHMGQLIFPELCHEVGDYFMIRKSLERLIEQEEWRLQMAREGLERLEAYNFENSKKKFMEMIA